ncbi:MAG: endonuclease, partial [Bacteroidaceae bacterium]|nr:endonuclease [Bacteroidaceae bacterium]
MKMRFLVLFSLALCVANVYAYIPAGYYNKAVGKKNAELKTAMHEIIKPHTRIDYGAKGTWVVFRSSDVRSNGAIWDMYSDVVRYFPESGSHPEMHIEHSVPKSWWGEESTFIYEASFDLHHLVPSDASAN